MTVHIVRLPIILKTGNYIYSIRYEITPLGFWFNLINKQLLFTINFSASHSFPGIIFSVNVIYISPHTIYSYKTMTGSSSYRFGVLARIVRHMKARHQEGDDHPLTIDEVLDETNQLDVGNKVKQVQLLNTICLIDPWNYIISLSFVCQEKWNRIMLNPK